MKLWKVVLKTGDSVKTYRFANWITGDNREASIALAKEKAKNGSTSLTVKEYEVISAEIIDNPVLEA